MHVDNAVAKTTGAILQLDEVDVGEEVEDNTFSSSIFCFN